MRDPARPETQMKTAVAVPSYDRPDKLRACLEALLALDPAPDEIVVVDDGSPTPLAPVCAAFGDRVRCIRQDNAGPAAARNRAVRASTAEFVALTDDDCRPAPDWLGRLIAAHGRAPGALLGGHVVNRLEDNVFAAASQSLADYLYAAGGAAAGAAEFFTTNNAAFARGAFLEMGGFDESFPMAAGEDRDFGRRWRAAGGALAYVPEAVVAHYHDMDWRGFWRQHANYGRGARILHRRVAARPGQGGRFQNLGFYGRLVLHPLRDRAPRPLARAALLGLSQLATTAGYLDEARRERRAP